MIDTTNNLAGVGKAVGSGMTSGMTSGAGEAGGSGFADALKKSIEEVSRMQQDANKAVEDLATGRSDELSVVMNAVEKADLAFKTLLAIRSKLMDAYEEIKAMQI